jgi:hypothetical protein
MKKQLFIIAFVLWTGDIFLAQIKIEYNLNPVFCLVQFTEQIGTEGTRPFIKNIFKESHFYKDTLLLRQISEFELLDFGSSIEYVSYPENHKTPANAWNFLMISAASSGSLKELEQKSYGLFPASVHAKIFTLLRVLEPVYHELIFDRFSSTTLQQIKKIETLAATKNLSNYFTRLAHFYGSSWNPEIPFRIQFYPIPGKSGFSATPKGNIIACGLLTEEKDLEGLLGVIFHEMSHILYDEQPAGFQHTLERWFEGTGIFAPLAYLLFNEAAATACGNGYIFEQLTGKTDPASWYDNPYINKQGKAIYPLTRSYIESGKTIDSVFVQEVKNIYAHEFGSVYNTFDNLLTNLSMLVFAPDENLNDFLRALTAKYRIRNFSYDCNKFSDDIMTEITDRIKTRFIIVAKNNSATIQQLKLRVPALTDLDLPAEGNYVLCFFDAKGMPYIFANFDDAEKLAKLPEVFSEQSIPVTGMFRKSL